MSGLFLFRIPNSEFRIRFRELVICNNHVEASAVKTSYLLS